MWRAAYKIRDFFFGEISPLPFVWLRLLLSVVLLLQAAELSNYVPSLFGRMGFLQSSVNDFFAEAGGNLNLARVLAQYASQHAGRYGMTDPIFMQGLFFAYVLALGALAVGFYTRAASVSSWLLHFLVFGAGHMSSYGVDRFAQSALFFLVWSPAGASHSWDASRGKSRPQLSPPPALALRGLQFYLCVAYLGAGVAKAMGEQWWNGEAIWRAILLTAGAPYQVLWLAHFSWIARLAAWGTIAIEIGYPLLVWSRRTRGTWVALVVSMHLGIALFLGLTSFAAVMAVLTFCAFGIDERVTARSPVPRFEIAVPGLRSRSSRPALS